MIGVFDSWEPRHKFSKTGVILVAVTLLKHLAVGHIEKESSQGLRFQMEPWFYCLLPELQGLDMLHGGIYLFHAVTFCVHIL